MLPIADPASERGRICAAMLDLVAADGYSQIEMAGLCTQANVDQVAFASHFTDLEACFTAIWVEADELIAARMSEAFGAPAPWRERIRAALAAGLDFLGADPAAAHLYVGEGLFVGDRIRVRHQASMRCLVSMIDRGRAEARDSARVPSEAAEGIAGGIWYRVQALVAAGQFARLSRELPEMMYLVIVPYLGIEAARAELQRPG